MSEFDRLVAASQSAEPEAHRELLDLLYDELRATAARLLAREKPGQTLQPTALVHEAWLRLAGRGEPPCWENERHFAAAAAEAMRRILVENARRKLRLKHGGEFERVPLDEDALRTSVPSDELLAIDEALADLAELDRPKAELVKLRYFAGLTLEEAGEVLNVSRATASRHWTHARAWLYDRIARDRTQE